MKISCNFDSGSIEVVKAESENNIELKIRKDSHSDFLQWFFFSITGEKNSTYNLKILNAGETSYVKGWENYNVCASYDLENWFRINTDFDGKILNFKHKSDKNTIYFAYFAPYTYERHLKLISYAQNSNLCKHSILGETLDGRNMSLLTIGSEESKNKVWIIARQHPGETMAEWFMEGLIHRLLNNNDATSKKLLEKTVFYLVPNMNPDGSVRGNLRTNASGANLNREWIEPSLEKSPEVFYVRNKIKEKGITMFFDIHGDEALPYNFVARCEGCPSYNEEIEKTEQKFIDHFKMINPDFQDVYGYEKNKHGEANLTLAGPYIYETHKCMALTVEMPFKDNANIPDKIHGWSPERSKELGASILNSINFMIG